MLNEVTEFVTPALRTDKGRVQNFVERVVEETAECSVEQLEQVYSALMREIWATRGEWNRTAVVDQMDNVLEMVLQDMGLRHPSRTSMDTHDQGQLIEAEPPYSPLAYTQSSSYPQVAGTQGTDYEEP